MQVTLNYDAGRAASLPVVEQANQEPRIDAAVNTITTSGSIRASILATAVQVGQLADVSILMLQKEKKQGDGAFILRAPGFSPVAEESLRSNDFADKDLQRSLSLKIEAHRSMIKNQIGGRHHENLMAAGPEMALMALSMEMTQIIDDMLKLRTEAQKARNESLNRLNDLSNCLRNYEKSKDEFSTERLEDAYKKFPADSPMMQKGIERQQAEMDKTIAAAYAAEKTVCDAAVASGLGHDGSGSSRDPYFYKKYYEIKPEWVTINEDGQLLFWKTTYGIPISEKVPLQSPSIFAPNRYRDKLIIDYNNKVTAITGAEKKFADYNESGKCTVADALYGFGVYEYGSTLPASKEDLETAHEKISTMTNSIDSEQSIKMTEISKFSQARNESYDMAVKVNNRLVDSLAALIRQLSER